MKHRKWEITKNVIWGIGTAASSALLTIVGLNILGDEPIVMKIVVGAIAAIGGAVAGFFTWAFFLRKI